MQTKLIDPDNLTNYGRTRWELEALLLFGILAAFCDGVEAAAILERWLKLTRCCRRTRPLPYLARYYAWRPGAPVDQFRLSSDLLACGQKRLPAQKAIHIKAALESGLDLSEASRDDLVEIRGVSFKTASMILLHSRSGWRGACLDTHLLRHLSETYPDKNIPLVSPQSRREYLRVEALFLAHCDQLGRDPAEYDLATWKSERVRPLSERRKPKKVSA